MKCVAVSINFTTNGSNETGSEFSVTAIVTVVVAIQSVNLAWMNSSGSELISTEIASSGMMELYPSGPVMYTLDLVFISIQLSQADYYTFMTIVTDNTDTVVLERTYILTLQGTRSFIYMYMIYLSTLHASLCLASVYLQIAMPIFI